MKDNLTKDDAPGWYECEVRCYSDPWKTNTIWWNRHVMSWGTDGVAVGSCYAFRNFRPLHPAEPEVVEGPCEIPAGHWLVVSPYGSTAIDQKATDRGIGLMDRAVRIPQYLIDALTPPKPKYTRQHLACAAELLPYANKTQEQLAEIVAEFFPSET